MEENCETVVLNYTIYKYSSYSANYVPENIMVNNPTDQLSRWFTDSTTPSQYIMLKLDTPAVVEMIKFGKYIKAHVSDLKKFQVFGGTDENNLSLLLTGGLRNDGVGELFRLRHRTTEGLYLPIQYLKIMPLQSWGPAYNYTIWYVELRGKNDEGFVNAALDTINLRKEEEAVKLLLKHLRRRRYKDAFEALSRETGVQLEGPIQARIFNALVDNGDFKRTEELLEEAVQEGEFDWNLSWQKYTPEWRQMSPCSPQVEADLGDCEPVCPLPDLHAEHRPEDGSPRVENAVLPEKVESSDLAPGPRGGHQLVVDATTGTLYLFGGWNGTEDLDDLWSFDTVAEKWTLLCRHSGQVNGPSPRSCHKMVFDPVHKRLYTLGRYLDSSQRIPASMNSDLYAYSTVSHTWSLVCFDTAACGGPRLVFDHQVCIDADTQTIYVFGGRVLPNNTEESATPQYSGLYAYYIVTGTWQQLLGDRHELPAPQPRVSHSMLFHPVQRRLYMFAGQRNRQHLLDLWWWDVNSGVCGALCEGSGGGGTAVTPRPPPASGFTQRATIDPDTDEIFVLSGMSKEKDKRVYNTLWVFSLRRLTWSCVYRNEMVCPTEPRPRFAHQLVYDPIRKIHYLFGGNPGNQMKPRLRLDDLWALKLKRPSLDVLLTKLRASVREACYRELCFRGEEMAAVQYLRTQLKDGFDHSDPEQVSHFHKLATVLFAGSAAASYRAMDAVPAPVSLTARRTRALQRRRANLPPPTDLSLHLAMVLGSEDSIPEAVIPFEEITLPPPDTWDVGEDEEPTDSTGRDDEAYMRAARLQLYDHLCDFFRPSVVPPLADVTDFVKL